LLFDAEETDALLKAISSRTARELLTSLQDEPKNVARLAEDVGTSIQNGRYHLEQLSDVDLVEVVGTWYSAKGTEMDVYAPTTDRVLIGHSDVADRSDHTESSTVTDGPGSFG
jgi:DNA-binding transcriptional ArsR family regulator